jgi:hypothetical protein
MSYFSVYSNQSDPNKIGQCLVGISSKYGVDPIGSTISEEFEMYYWTKRSNAEIVLNYLIELITGEQRFGSPVYMYSSYIHIYKISRRELLDLIDLVNQRLLKQHSCLTATSVNELARNPYWQRCQYVLDNGLKCGCKLSSRWSCLKTKWN